MMRVMEAAGIDQAIGDACRWLYYSRRECFLPACRFVCSKHTKKRIKRVKMKEKQERDEIDSSKVSQE